ncbi:symmetrical bis(5'-nucleosyl)-tetraphosphatase [Buchnera aphidicola]|uniref:symmetrical bis(5'-nucleosyl)-tetraphosphatase n=1 Tax=Buchnera aphidicola TaxID=9 RepID=UPI002237C36A|nr:symmetrical bis(5'-nucleosyl)-tetraphosphatase [Buchnera aphidicola]MCW5197639.1 symmetrical bis(5'-nucleosyl)-tetraphosphatase [Buchnera aphidicola (Chaitophorus viminalis)]
MSTYFIGDIHGCYDQFYSLLEKVKFNSVKDEIWITGDLVGRGPKSLEVLKFIFSLKNKAKLVLGNHDLNLLSIYFNVEKKSIEKEISELLNCSDLSFLINKLKNTPLIQYDLNKKLVMSHAGIFPKWTMKEVIKYSKEAQNRLSGKNFLKYLKCMKGDFPNIWSSNLNKYDRFRFIINSFTRMRYCHLNGELDFNYKDTPPHFNKNLIPWFLIKNKLKPNYSIFFGHWSSLRNTTTPENIFSLDTGCCWGRKLTILRWEDKRFFTIKCNLFK